MSAKRPAEQSLKPRSRKPAKQARDLPQSGDGIKHYGTSRPKPLSLLFRGHDFPAPLNSTTEQLVPFFGPERFVTLRLQRSPNAPRHWSGSIDLHEHHGDGTKELPRLICAMHDVPDVDTFTDHLRMFLAGVFR
jgi:hypothetical protein